MDHFQHPTRPARFHNARTDPNVRQAISIAFSRLRLRERVRVLRRLLLPAGPMALAVLAGGVFAKYIRQARSPRMLLTVEDVASVTSAQVFELARYAEQSKPSALQQAMRVIERSSAMARGEKLKILPRQVPSAVVDSCA